MGKMTTQAALPLEVKQEDTRVVAWEIPGFDLTGTTATLFLKRNGVVTERPLAVRNPPTAGVVELQLDGTLEIGEYLIEAELIRDGLKTTVPSSGYAKLRITPDLED